MTTDDCAKIIWDYMHMNHRLEKSDLIIGFGSHDIRTAQYAAKLFLDNWARKILFCGKEGFGRDISGFKGISEATVFANEAIKFGVPKQAILIEENSTNTGENVRFSYELLKSKGILPKRIIAVTKPYMERRLYTVLKAQLPKPQPDIILGSPPLSFNEYISDQLYYKDYTINVMVGDLQRIKEYPKFGFQIEQEIPNDVWEAFKALVAQGYDKHLLKGVNV